MSSSRPEGRIRRALSGLPLRTRLIALFTLAIIAVSLAIGGITQVLLTRYLTEQLDRQVSAAAVRLSGPPPGKPGFGEQGLGEGVPGAAGPGEPGLGEAGTSDSGAAEPGTPSDQGTPSDHSAPGSQGTPGDHAASQSTDALCQAGSLPSSPGSRQPDNSIFAIHPINATPVEISAAVREAFPSCTVLTADQAAPLLTVAQNTPTTVDLGELGSYRVIASTQSGTVFISGLSTATISATRTQLVTILAAVTGSAVLLGGLAVWWSVRRSLAGLEQVAATARAATGLPLGEGGVEIAMRVPDRLTDARTEVGAVGGALNSLLDHVGDALAARERSEAKVRQFVADASHELRTPLTAIRGYAELAGRHPDDVPGVRRALSRVESESTRMSALVEDLLLLARLDEGRPLATDPVDLTALAVDAVADAKVAGPEHQWRTDVPDSPVLARGDASRIQQIVANLLANARLHTPPGTSVHVELSAEGAMARVIVIDDGPGIEPALADSLFDRFVRGDGSRARGGTGLGLAIAASLARAQGGSLTVASAPGRTAFTLLLPLDPSAA